MKNLKIFETPRITFLHIASCDVIAASAVAAPTAVFENQLDVWDVYEG